MGMMFLEVMTTEVKAEAADKARRELFGWMDVEGYAPDGFDTTGLLSWDILTSSDEEPFMPPWLGMPSPGEPLLGWSEIEWLWKIPDAILEKGEQVFTQYSVPEIWQQIVGQVAYSTSKVDAATRGIAPNMVLNTKDGPKSLDEQARSCLGP